MSKITQQKKAAKKINEILPKITHVSVEDDSYTDVTSYPDPDDDWGRESTHTSHHIRGIRVHPSYGDIDCMFEIEPEKTYYLLYYLHDTGDSFGSDTGRIEFVELYRDEKLADKSCAALNKYKSGSHNMVTIWNDAGKPYEEYVSDDYFGGFTGAEVVAVQLIS